MTDAGPSQDLTQLVRRGDYARFLAIQIAPRADRPALYTITGFAVEMGRIPSITSEPLIGMMRFTWWREHLESIAAGGAPREHPLLESMAQLHASHPSAFGDALAMIARYQEAIETETHAEVADLISRAWAGILGPSQSARVEAILKWLTGQDKQRLHRPGTIGRLLWKALKSV